MDGVDEGLGGVGHDDFSIDGDEVTRYFAADFCEVIKFRMK